MTGIYKITCLKDGKIYIGQSVSLKKRITNHKCALRRGTHSNSHLQNAWSLYGEDVFVFEIIKECDEKELDTNEISILKSFGYPDNKKVFNLESGGNKNKHLSEETKEKIRNKHLGTHVSEETKMKISKSSTGRKMSDETKKKISLSRTGKHPTEETLKKMSVASSGTNNWHYGKHVDEDVKQKIRKNNPNTKIVLQFTIDGKFVKEHLGTYLASKEVSTGSSHIIQCCNGQRKTAGGYIWRYKKGTH